MDSLFNSNIWLSLLTLSLLEIILSLDNLLFITLTIKKLPKQQRNRARTLGLGLAMITRIILLLTLLFLTQFNMPILTVMQYTFSAKDIIFIIGGLFLCIKSIIELYCDIQKKSTHYTIKNLNLQWPIAMLQIAFIDIVFSLDSVITAIGLTQMISVMVTAIILSMFAMLFFSKKLEHIIEKHAVIKTVALIILVFIGLHLIAEGFHINLNNIL
ncbi:MAG: TerC family protein [Endozoicomonadaceae bacterium]|nr:TerC family protein [Endozoicomonadaceae bacterium]